MTREAVRAGTGLTALVAVEQKQPRAERIDDALAAAFPPFAVRAFVGGCGP